MHHLQKISYMIERIVDSTSTQTEKFMDQPPDNLFVQKLRFKCRWSSPTESEIKVIAQINNLRRILNPHAAIIRPGEVRRIAQAQYGCIVILGTPLERLHPQIFGMATLTVYTKLGARVGTIEDVVVDPSCRGKGMGRALVESLIRRARGQGITYLSLTSNPERVEAIALYQSLGFVRRDTNSFRLVL